MTCYIRAHRGKLKRQLFAVLRDYANQERPPETDSTYDVSVTARVLTVQIVAGILTLAF
jgi:hypothetical protein